MFSVIYKNRVITCRYFTPVVGDLFQYNGTYYTIVEVNYYSKAVWIE